MAMPGVLRADTVDAGKDTIKEYLQALEANPNDKEALKIVGFYYMNRGDYHKATRYAKRLLDLGKASGDRDFCELYGRVIIGSIMIEDEPDSCFRCLERARSIAESTSNRDALLSVNNGLGMYYLLVHNDPYTASTYYYEALEDAKAIGDERRYGIILSNLSGVYISLNDISGLKLAEQSYQIARKRGEPMPLYYAAYSLAHFYLMTDSLDRAGYFIDEVERLHGEGGFDGNGNPYLYRARLAEKRGDIDAAYGYYVDAMQNFGDSDASSVSATYLDYARLLRRDGHAASAIKVLEYALRYIAKAGLVAVIAVIILLAFYFSRKLNASMAKIESKFLDNLNERELRRSGKKNAVVHDLHQAYMTVGTGCSFAGERLMDSNLRNRFGVNVVSIQRGSNFIPIPNGRTRIYPGDILGIIGTDDQIEKLLPQIEASAPLQDSGSDPSKMKLTSVLLGPDSPLISRTPRSSSLRDTYDALVVAVDRGEEHIDSQPDLVFQEGDIIWLVGNPSKLAKLK